MIIKSESITKGPSDHLHVADASKLHARIVVANMKNETIHTQQLPQQIISATHIPAGVVGAMPSVSSIKKYPSSNSQKERLRSYGSKIAFLS